MTVDGSTVVRYPGLGRGSVPVRVDQSPPGGEGPTETTGPAKRCLSPSISPGANSGESRLRSGRCLLEARTGDRRTGQGSGPSRPQPLVFLCVDLVPRASETKTEVLRSLLLMGPLARSLWESFGVYGDLSSGQGGCGAPNCPIIRRTLILRAEFRT